MVSNAAVSLDVLKKVLSKDLKSAMVIHGQSSLAVYDMLDGVERDYVEAGDLSAIMKSSNARVVVVKGFDDLDRQQQNDFRKMVLETKWRKGLVIPTTRGFSDSVEINNRVMHITQIDR